MKIDSSIERFRIRSGKFTSDTNDLFGFFTIPGPNGMTLTVVASSAFIEEGQLWDHVSVSTRKRTPSWNEMCFIKDLFWDEEETVIQLHPPKSQYISNHPYCLHLWKAVGIDFPLPPSDRVGNKEIGELPIPAKPHK